MAHDSAPVRGNAIPVLQRLRFTRSTKHEILSPLWCAWEHCVTKSKIRERSSRPMVRFWPFKNKDIIGLIQGKKFEWANSILCQSLLLKSWPQGQIIAFFVGVFRLSNTRQFKSYLQLLNKTFNTFCTFLKLTFREKVQYWQILQHLIICSNKLEKMKYRIVCFSGNWRRF